MNKVTFTLLFLLSARLVTAQASLDSISLYEVVVSANRWCQERESVPYKVSRTTFEEWNKYNPQTAADLLGLGGEVFVQKSQYGGGSPMIRGFSANRLLYSIDGVRMNSAIFRAGNLQNVISLDPFAIESSEILFGPGAVSYGSDAIGGTMVFNTLRPRLSETDAPTVLGAATVRTATASNEFTAHVHAGVGWKHWALLTSFTTLSFGDLKQGTVGPREYIKPYIVVPEYNKECGTSDRVLINNDERLQSPSGYTQQNFMQKLRYSPNGEWNLEYAFHFSATSEYARYDRHLRVRDSQPRYAEWNYGPQKWIMNHLLVEHKGANLLYDTMRVNVALQRFEESRISRDFGKTRREVQSEKVDALSANVDFLKAPHRTLSLAYGFEYVLNEVFSKGVAADIVTEERQTMPSRYPRATWHSAGLFAQARWDILPRLQVAAGVRYNYYFIKSDFSTAGYEVPFAHKQENNASSISANIGVNYRPVSGWLFRANYARGFRAPNVDDLGKLFDNVDGYVTVPNPTLKPEYVDNVEIGVAKHFGNYLKFDLSAYYSVLDNAIVRRDFLFNGAETMEYGGEMCRVQALQNAAVARVWGVQLALNSRFARCFYATARASWQRGFEELDNGDTSPSRHVAPLFGRVATGYDDGRLTMETFVQFQAECSADDMPEEEKEKKEIYALDAAGNAYSPAWATINLRVGYKVLPSLRLNATLENIADSRYRPYSSGISAPGRNFTISLTYNLE